MSRTAPFSSAASYALRLLEDEDIQDQIGQALAQLRRGQRRATSQKAADALTDRKLRGQVRSAAEALIAAGRAASAPPAAKRHPVRRVLVLAAAAGAAGLAWQKLTRTDG
jgi:hypothetical protein